MASEHRLQESGGTLIIPLFPIANKIQFCPWGRKDKRGAENLIIHRGERGRTFNNRSLSKPQLTVLFFIVNLI